MGSEFELTTNILYNDSELRIYFQDDWFVDECSNVKLPPISALVIYKNSFIVILNSRGKLGSKLKYSLSPECSFLIAGASATVNRNRARPKINAIFQMRK